MCSNALVLSQSPPQRKSMSSSNSTNRDRTVIQMPPAQQQLSVAAVIPMQPYLPYQPHHAHHTPLLHRHAELAQIERSRLLWEESLRLSQHSAIQSLQRERQIALYAQHHKAEQRQIRLQRFIQQSKEQSFRQMEQLRLRVLQEQVEYQNHVRKMKLERAYHNRSGLIFDQATTHFPKTGPGNGGSQETQQIQGIVLNRRQENTLNGKHKPEIGKDHEQAIQDVENRIPSPQQVSDRVLQDPTLAFLGQQPGNQDRSTGHNSKIESRRASIMKDRNREKVFSFSRDKKQVKFQSSRSQGKKKFLLSPRKSELRNISERHLRGDAFGDAQQRIVNRLRHSEVVYKDSQFRNTKHEMDHLVNTFENERKVRDEIRVKINHYPSIMASQGIVVEPN